jgi:hypothetical protein
LWRDGEGKREHDRNHPFGRLAPGPKGGLHADLAETVPANSNVRPVPAKPLQELGMIEAGSKVEITASWKE